MPNLQTGVVYTDELLPIHRSSSGYVRGAMVIPDGSEWLKVKFSDGEFAYKKDGDVVKAKDINGNIHWVHLYHSHFITAYDDNGKKHYFLDEESARAFEFEFSINLNRYHDKKSSNFFGRDTLLPLS